MSCEDQEEMISMARRYLLWLLTGLLLTGLLAGVSGCKEEKEAFPR